MDVFDEASLQLSLLKISSPDKSPHFDEEEFKTPGGTLLTPSSARYNIRRCSTPAAIVPTPNFVARKIGRRLSLPAVVQFPKSNAHYRLPTSVLHLIMLFIDFESPQEVTNLELVCRQFKKALELKCPQVHAIWKTLLIKKWGSDALTREETICKLSFKHVFERRFLQTQVPLDMAKQKLTTLLDMQNLTLESELEIAAEKRGPLLEQGRILHHIAMVNAENPIEIAEKFLAKSKTNPAYALDLINGLFSKNEFEIRDAVIRYRQLLSIADNPNIEAVRDLKIIPRFVEIMRSTKVDQIKFEVVWVLTNICSGDSEYVQEVVNSGALPFLVDILWDKTIKLDDIVTEQAIWALGNICGDSLVFRKLVLEQDAIPILTTRLLRSNLSRFRISFIRNTCWFLSNCVRAQPRPPFWQTKSIVDIFSKTVLIPDSDVLCDTLWGVSYMVDGCAPEEARFILKRIYPSIILSYAGNVSPVVAAPALHIISHLFHICPLICKQFLSSNVLKVLSEVISRRVQGRTVNLCLSIVNTLLQTCELEFEELAISYPELLTIAEHASRIERRQ